MHSNYDKLNVIGRLTDIGTEHTCIGDDILKMVGKIACPPTPPPPYGPPAPSAKQPVSPTLDELLHAKKFGKIPGIKAYRNRTGGGLKEAKEAIEKAMGYLGWGYGPGNGFGTGTGFLFEDLEPLPF